MYLLVIIALLALSWGASNRGRGWGPQGANPPVWQVRLAKALSRDTMALWHGLTVCWFAAYLNQQEWWVPLVLGTTTALFWRLAVTPGWGEYQDGSKANNDESVWIEWLVNKAVLPCTAKVSELMLWQGRSKRIKALAPKVLALTTDARYVDGVSMGLRGAWYLPIYLTAWWVTGSAWFLLPAVVFWQAGAVYACLWPKQGGDVTFWAEWVDDTVRGLLYFTAIALALA